MLGPEASLSSSKSLTNCLPPPSLSLASKNGGSAAAAATGGERKPKLQQGNSQVEGTTIYGPNLAISLDFFLFLFFKKKRFFVCVMDGRLQVIFEKKIYFFCCLFLAGLHPLPLVSANCFVGQGIQERSRSNNREPCVVRATNQGGFLGRRGG